MPQTTSNANKLPHPVRMYRFQFFTRGPFDMTREERTSEEAARSAYTESQSKNGVYDHWLSMAGVSHTGVLAGSPGRCASGDAAPADATAQWKGAQWLRLALAAVADAHGQHIENRAA